MNKLERNRIDLVLKIQQNQGIAPHRLDKNPPIKAMR